MPQTERNQPKSRSTTSKKPANKKPAQKRSSSPQATTKDHRTTPERRKAFLEAYAQTCNVRVAAKRAGIARRTHYIWLEQPEYVAKFLETKRLAAEYLESVAVERATIGWNEPIHYQGVRVGSVRRFDGGLLQFLLRGAMPEKYGHKTEVTGPQGTPLQAEIKVTFVKPSSGPDDTGD